MVPVSRTLLLFFNTNFSSFSGKLFDFHFYLLYIPGTFNFYVR